MNNPWEEISLDDYEKHMALDSVKQLGALSELMKGQLGYDAESVMILGIAGGNGLEHIDSGKYRTVYGVDINERYLDAVRERYKGLSGILRCIRADLLTETDKLPRAQLLIADLLIEYIGCDAFKKVVRQVRPEYVSCVIQVNRNEGGWVSDSPYIHAFDRLDEVHHNVERDALAAAMDETGYTAVYDTSVSLTNGKALARFDFKKRN